MRNFQIIVGYVFAFALVMFPAYEASAAVSPVALSILAPVQLPPESFSVAGARVSALWGDHRDVWGLDVGAIGNITDNSFAGIAVSGVFNYNRGMATVVGLQAAGFGNFNVNKARVVGLQIAAVVNSNRAESSVLGLQLALANLSQHTNIYGLQAGAYNRANEVYGFQFGLINEAENLHGVQVGLLNFNHKGLFAIAPILNIGF
jgi:hypothetical protein